MVKERRLKAYLALAAVFVLGAAAGGGASYAFAQQRHAALFGEEGRATFERGRMRAMARKLDLDADQQQRISAVLAKARDEGRDLSRAMLEQCGQPLRDQRARVDAEIRAILRPDQQERYDELVDERREHLWLGPSGSPRRQHGRRDPH
jgi:Spy/CpxP family protein refolding chaperone